MDEHKPILTYDIRSAMEVSQNPYQGEYKRHISAKSFKWRYKYAQRS